MNKIIAFLTFLIFVTGCNFNITFQTPDYTIISDPNQLSISDGKNELDIRAGATIESHAFCLWNDPALGFGDIDDAYVMIVNSENGDMYDADATTPTVTTTYADAAIELDQDEQNTEFACGTIPATDSYKNLILCVYENSTPTLGDSVKACYNYDQLTGFTFTDTVPTFKQNVKTITGH